MAEWSNVALLAGDAALYFAVLAGLFRARARLGLGAFFCALGVMHFLETYLASIFYVALPGGIVASPGSTILFTGKLMLLLLVYIREDARVVRQPIYGLLIGNLLLFALAFLMRRHWPTALTPDRFADLGFLDEMGALMVWGTLVLFADCILIILLYEKARNWLGQMLLARLAVVGAVVLSFDQAAFYIGLRVLTGADAAVLVGGWLAKLAAVALFSAFVAVYLRFFERARAATSGKAPRIADVFDMLTYRERYEDLLSRSGRDALTGAFDRGRLETHGRALVERAAVAGNPVSLLLIDIDHFKSFNDRFGHARGDAVLRQIATEIMATVRSVDPVFRFGGEEFVVLAEGLNSEMAVVLGERLRASIAASGNATGRVTVSIGIATCATDATDYDSLFEIADRRLYRAKAAGRNCVIGERSANVSDPVQLVAKAMP
ncbi:MAG TPA: GGDEF domain-containing protein [Pseudolabrys sp.]|nr:GGDEF domain-containing protein [Pseudolabrys sp.]